MDYAYSGSAADWSMVSTVASVVGVLMVFGRQLGRGGMALDDLRRSLAWLVQPWLACLAMLAVPLAFPGSSWVSNLRGAARLESELEMARADGYYEELIRSSGDHRKPRQAERPPGRRSFTESGLMDEVSDYRRRVLRPGLDAHWNGSSFRTNGLGFRGPEISRGKPPGTFRVAVLGSSNTMGHGVEDEESYPRLLEGWLAARARGGRRVEVVNLAVSGDSPTQRLLRLQAEAAGLEPDWILCDITALDFSLEEQHLRWVVGKGTEIPFDFVREALAGSRAGPGDSTDEFHEKFRPFLKPLLDRTIGGWAAESRRIGVPLTMVILPRADSKTESPGIFQLFRDSAGRHGLPYVDLTDTFDRLELDDYRIAPWDHHPNALGHRLIFARLRDGLLDDRAFGMKLEGRGPIP
jgi:GDSL-like Lipase/Acylhydrolase family